MAYPSFRFKPNDIYTDKLDGDITGATDPINSVDNTNAKAGPGLIKVANEIIKYTTKGSNQFSGLTRGYNNTTATVHSNGDDITHPISADIFVKIWEAIEAIYGGALDIVTTKGDILVASAADTLARLGIGAANTLLYVNTDTPGWATADALDILDKTTVQTLTNKRITKREVTIASSAAPTPNGDITDIYTITQLTQNATFGAPTGTPTQGQLLLIRIKDGGVAKTLGWNVIYRAGTDIALPTITIASKTMYVLLAYNTTDSKWDLVDYIDNI